LRLINTNKMQKVVWFETMLETREVPSTIFDKIRSRLMLLTKIQTHCKIQNQTYWKISYLCSFELRSPSWTPSFLFFSKIQAQNKQSAIMSCFSFDLFTVWSSPAVNGPQPFFFLNWKNDYSIESTYETIRKFGFENN
jgi:hypothetical protein